MTRLAVLLVALLLAVAVLPAAAQQSSDSATLVGNLGVVGQQFELTLEVTTPAGATVEVDPASASWAGVEVVELVSTAAREAGDQLVHTVVLHVAAFRTGDFAFQPAVNVIQGTEITGRVLPTLQLSTVTTLVPGEPLELHPLAPPASIRGAESVFLVPALVLAAVAAVAAVALLVYLTVRWLLGRRVDRPAEALEVPANPDLAYAESILDADPIGAYRHMAATVRSVIAGRYGFPARSLTTTELETRMSTAGVDRWQARLVSGLLAECDAVVYAGYRPAAERRHADFAMAQQIVEAAP